MPFAKLRLIEPLLRAVRSEGYTIPTAIQKQAIPHVLEGRDILGCAQTGTGKTAAFALPILQLLMKNQGEKKAPHAPQSSHAHHTHAPQAYGPDRQIRAMVLTPTRELAAQIGDSFGVYGQFTGLRHTTIFGGVGQGAQSQALRRGVDILVATPGRLLDLMGQKLLTLKHVEIFVLDEADRMLDMGFFPDVKRIRMHLPEKRQTLMFSATMPPEIRRLADSLLSKPEEVYVPSESVAADTVDQVVYLVEGHGKFLLLEQILKGDEITRVLVFTRTKRGADRVTERLCRSGVKADAIHSNKSQNARLRALADFKRGASKVLVASDIAARGLDVDNISHVINYDLPQEAGTYVHRIGRTGRAGATGKAISFCSSDQRCELAAIEKLLCKRIKLLPHNIPAEAIAESQRENPEPPRRRYQPRNNRPSYPRSKTASSDFRPHSLPRTAPAAPPRQHSEQKSASAAPAHHRPHSAKPSASNHPKPQSSSRKSGKPWMRNRRPSR